MSEGKNSILELVNEFLQGLSKIISIVESYNVLESTHFGEIAC